MPDALPAVTVPFSFWNTGFSFVKSSALASRRTCSSVSNATSLLRADRDRQDLILEAPFRDRARARRCDSSASASCASREMPYFAATFSAVTPMWIVWNGSCSAPSIMSTSLPSPMRWPKRAAGTVYGARLMLSEPPPIAMSASPSMIVCAADTIACRPEPHRRFTVSAGVCCATPPLIAATRARYMSFGSVFTTCPNTTCPTASPDTFARDSTSATTFAPRSVGEKSFRLPPKSPIAVRTPLTTTTSFAALLIVSLRFVRARRRGDALRYMFG